MHQKRSSTFTNSASASSSAGDSRTCSTTASSLAAFCQQASSFGKHFTASAVIIEQGYILLVHHKRIGAWLPPGGHIEEKEMPHEAVIREVKEETGIDIMFMEENLPATKDADAFFLPSPLCVQAVKAIEKRGDFYHIDLAYLCKPVVQSTQSITSYSDGHSDVQADDCAANAPAVSLPAIKNNGEVHEVRWVKLSELSELSLAANVIEIVDLAMAKLGLHI